MPLPRLIPLDARPHPLEDGSTGVALHDPLGVVTHVAVLSSAAWWVAARLDGRHSPEAVVEEARAQGMTLDRADVERLAERLGEAGFLHGPAHDALRARASEAFRSLPSRPPACAGAVYPADAGALRAALEGWAAAAPPRRGARRKPSLLVAPHIDYPRGARGYARAYAALQESDADLFVVFGTAHETPAHLFTLTRRHYGTPLGPVATDRPAVDALVAELGAAELLADERCHEREHSVELQLVLLRHLVRRPFTALPVLCSSISHLEEPARSTDRFLDALARAVRGRRVCFVAGADLAHVGPLYGDPRPPT
ncbi:MAG TPA: AmmeMemoRadiSam system protein B, partial [Anaeromyxobacter sp.]